MKELNKSKESTALNFSKIINKVLLILASGDKMVSAEESLQIKNSLPNSNFNYLPDSKHPLESCDINKLSEVISNFIL